MVFDKIHRTLRPNGLLFVKVKAEGEKGNARDYFTKEYMKEKLGKFRIIRIRKTSSKMMGFIENGAKPFSSGFKENPDSQARLGFSDLQILKNLQVKCKSVNTLSSAQRGRHPLDVDTTPTENTSYFLSSKNKFWNL